MKELILVRGLPGAGKSTFAKTLGGYHIETDMFFTDEETGEYKFEAAKLKHAHNWCSDVVENRMEGGEEKIVVSNTFTQKWEMDYYFTLALTYGYKVYSIIVENRHEGKSVHDVPAATMGNMLNRFEVKL